MSECAARSAAQDIHDEVASSYTRVKHLHAWGGQRCVELTLQDFLHAGIHKLDDLLRCVDDAMCAGLFDGKALKEPLIDGIEKVLFLCPAIERLGGSFNRNVEAIQRFLKVVAVKGAAGQRANHCFDLGGDHVAIDEVRVIEDRAKQALGQKVLYQHLINGCFKGS